MVLVFALAAWSRQPWPWLVAAVVATTMQDLRTVNFDLSDTVLDWVFIGFVFLMGRMVHRRTAQTDELNNRLRLAELDREARTQEAVSRERTRIARELHDIVAHAVSLMVVQAGTARPHAERLDRELADVLETIEHSGREALIELRRLLHVLRSDDEPDGNRFQTSHGSTSSSTESDVPGSRSMPASTYRVGSPRALRCVPTARSKRG